ncbi:Hypothetical protein MCYN_0411 [Mycoplasmopsis cynos C142]|uniref:Uncharacterized protein n=1 Tax=Mycoplasmopsis cynos (strain C142) TaxID=1246955 RepID=L0RUK3_MYCC1|nr:Hypothetical protein MCYN_0411 [Mycoplasmopsis cynos C142]
MHPYFVYKIVNFTPYNPYLISSIKELILSFTSIGFSKKIAWPQSFIPIRSLLYSFAILATDKNGTNLSIVPVIKE